MSGSLVHRELKGGDPYPDHVPVQAPVGVNRAIRSTEIPPMVEKLPPTTRFPVEST